MYKQKKKRNKESSSGTLQNQFSARGVRPIPANMRFKCIDGELKEDMVGEFSEE
jgi:hypothetical protein